MPETSTDGMIPPDAPGLRRHAGTIDDAPRARGGLDLTSSGRALAAPDGQVATGATRLSGSIDWATTGGDAVTIQVGVPAAHAPPTAAATTVVHAPGAWWIDVPLTEGSVVISAWSDSGGDGPDVTDLSARPVTIELGSASSPIALQLGPPAAGSEP